MLTRELISPSLPTLHLSDKVFNALQMMNDCHVSHLAVIDDGKYIGMVNEEGLMQAPDDTAEIREMKEHFPTFFVNANDHFLKALQLAVENRLSVIPVIDENKDLLGVVSYREMLKKASEFMNVKDPGGLIVLEMENNNYSFSEISRLVETNDAQITQLNSYTDPQTGLMQVTIKINKTEISDIVATFQRYEYNVKYYFGEELYENELRSNYDNLMNYLKL
ncbi:MAG TPA: CBS domain-containing protein [Chitinophagaceae bacterium]|nr:CBS domain-containing protein [Chitinophagaceae bacterium]